ncbi:MAG TPA: type II toxin-antitoxin system RelE/ParE family toxin [Thermotogota bacterium]|nr:type II toxin-antitoxin system RelE/ParE family toxin [Thermotogota bacterium]HRW34783.1 type II toxin-antitoxin system RelE/ParE family toxin [Thermotogota bacterium]
MTFSVEYTSKALEQFKKLDRQTAAFIISYVEKRLVNCTDPRRYGKSLQGNLKDKWRYRVGNYRILAKIEDDRIIIVILEVGHRYSIYLEK